MGEESEKRNNKVGIVATVSKKPRHRKKQLYQGLKRQMEFYFSDVNVSKDRFMNELLQQSPFVDLSVFLNFNRIKAVTSNVKDIASALQTSELLKVTDCGTKVYRVTPLQEKQNSDECTIYVEQMPMEVDHNWLTEIFQVYGAVDYVSIPKYKHSRKNKGFAFVEFKDAQSAKNALTAFSEMGCCLSTEIDPASLCSIKTFAETETTDKKSKSDEKTTIDANDNGVSMIPQVEKGQANEENSDNTEENRVIVTTSKKRKKSSSRSEDSTSDSKKRVLSTDCRPNDSNVSSSSEKNDSINNDEVEVPRLKTKRKLSESNNESVDDDGEISGKMRKRDCDNATDKASSSVCDADNGSVRNDDAEVRTSEISGEENVGDISEDYMNEDERRKKNRKRRKKHKRNKSVDNNHGLQVLSKMEWKSLRNKYLNEQRKKMKELKQYIWKYNNTKYNNKKETGDEKNMKYEEDDKEQTKEGVTVSNRLTLTPGVIVKVTLNEPVISKSSFKNEAKIFPEIKYTDFIDGSNTVYVRFSSPSAAEECVKSAHWPNADVIKGTEEKAYWDKIIQEREEKLSKGRTTKKGRDKLLKKAEELHVKHIWFD